MRKKAVIFSLLLLPFWLAAVACNYTDVFDGNADPSDYQSDGSGGAGQSQDSNSDVTPVKHTLHHLSRRVVSVVDDRFSLGAGTIADTTSVSPPGSRISLVESPADLLQSWRFYLRVASEPRAPSLVS